MSDNNKQIENTFNECLENIILNRCQAEDCLPAGAEYRPELQPLLSLVSQAHVVSAIEPDPGFRARARNEFRTALYDAASRRKGSARGWSWRTAMILPLAAATLMVSGGGVLAASSSSLPDSFLYGVKLAVEDIQLKLTLSPDVKTGLYGLRADRRIGEIISMAQTGNLTAMESAVMRLEADYNNITGLTARNLEAAATDSKSQSGATGTPSLSTTMGGMSVTSPAPATLTPDAGPPQENAVGSLNPITNQALLDMLITYAGKHPSDLVELLDKVPASTRPLLEYVIQLSSDYQQVLDQMAASLN